METIDVNFESPAARNADGKIKLTAHRIGWKIAQRIVIIKMVPIISSGALNIFINKGNVGNINNDVTIKNMDDSPKNDFVNFRASLIFLLPIH